MKENEGKKKKKNICNMKKSVYSERKTNYAEALLKKKTRNE